MLSAGQAAHRVEAATPGRGRLARAGGSSSATRHSSNTAHTWTAQPVTSACSCLRAGADLRKLEGWDVHAASPSRLSLLGDLCHNRCAITCCCWPCTQCWCICGSSRSAIVMPGAPACRGCGVAAMAGRRKRHRESAAAPGDVLPGIPSRPTASITPAGTSILPAVIMISLGAPAVPARSPAARADLWGHDKASALHPFAGRSVASDMLQHLAWGEPAGLVCLRFLPTNALGEADLERAIACAVSDHCEGHS